ncbi:MULTISPECIES: TIGR04206 family protein [Halorussus]|uniref:TIGR04206 family protein n=1 Tax=Halorussus TaxID=1070314 RepID=UPI0020A1F3B9|nr:TIGR04206 family protein [Halorussus vallis]USZ75887.1 TIGR04206 family protein [Halorussus vallis]
MGDARRRTSIFALLATLALLFVPWTILGGRDFVFLWGLATLDPVHVTTITDYLFVYTAGLPRRLLAWPVSSLLYLLAVGSAAGGLLVGREDRRVTAGLLVLSGVSHLWFALGMVRRSTLVAIPLGTVLVWAVAWWFYWPDLRAMVVFDDSRA